MAATDSILAKSSERIKSQNRASGGSDQRRKKKVPKRILFALVAFLLGLGLVFAAIIIDLDQKSLSFTTEHILEIYSTDQLLVIITVTPWVLAAISFLIGQLQDKLELTSSHLNHNIAERDQELKYSHEFFQALAKNSPLALAQLDSHHLVISTNQAFEQLFGYSEIEMIGRSLDDLITTPQVLQEARSITQSVMDGKVTHQKSQRKKSDGELVDVEILGIPVFVRNEQIGGIGLYRDISHELASKTTLLENEARYRSLFEDSPISLWEEDFSDVKAVIDEIKRSEVTDFEVFFSKAPDQVMRCLQAVKIINVNKSTLQLYGAAKKAELLASLDQIVREDGRDQFTYELVKLAEGVFNFTFEISQFKLNGEKFYAELSFSIPEEYQDTWERVYISIIDITERKMSKEKLLFISFHDSLTGLYNYAYFQEELQRLENSRQYPVTIMMCDMNDLKRINDTYGHQAGDQAIQAAAKALCRAFRSEDVVARIGGDEFAIVLPRIDEEKASLIAERVTHEINRYNHHLGNNGNSHPLSLSIGMVTVPYGQPLAEGMKIADNRMYQHKEETKKKG